MPSLFSHHTSCLKPTSRWRIITIIKADSWKWMVISPLGSSSSLHFPFSLFLACHCPCYKQCQVLIFCLSRSTSAQYALTDTDRHPLPSQLGRCYRKWQQTGIICLPLDCHCPQYTRETSVLWSMDPTWHSDREHAWWVRQQSMACLLCQKYLCTCSQI